MAELFGFKFERIKDSKGMRKSLLLHLMTALLMLLVVVFMVKSLTQMEENAPNKI